MTHLHMSYIIKMIFVLTNIVAVTQIFLLGRNEIFYIHVGKPTSEVTILLQTDLDNLNSLIMVYKQGFSNYAVFFQFITKFIKYIYIISKVIMDRVNQFHFSRGPFAKLTRLFQIFADTNYLCIL